MAEELILSRSKNKNERYKTLLPQLEALVHGEEDLIANLANIAAALKQTMDFFWVGFYLVKKRSARAWSLPGTHCMYAYWFRKWSLRHGMERKEDDYRAERR